MIQLGAKGKDIITGFEGLIMGHARYLTGCSQVLITPQSLDKDGNTRDGRWFDEQRVQMLDTALVVLQNHDTPGLDESLPPIA